MASLFPTIRHISRLVECPLCIMHLRIPTLTNCGHVFCKMCIIKWLKLKKTCPVCRLRISRPTRLRWAEQIVDLMRSSEEIKLKEGVDYIQKPSSLKDKEEKVLDGIDVSMILTDSDVDPDVLASQRDVLKFNPLIYSKVEALMTTSIESFDMVVYVTSRQTFLEAMKQCKAIARCNSVAVGSEGSVRFVIKWICSDCCLKRKCHCIETVKMLERRGPPTVLIVTENIRDSTVPSKLNLSIFYRVEGVNINALATSEHMLKWVRSYQECLDHSEYKVSLSVEPSKDAIVCEHLEAVISRASKFAVSPMVIAMEGSTDGASECRKYCTRYIINYIKQMNV